MKANIFKYLALFLVSSQTLTVICSGNVFFLEFLFYPISILVIWARFQVHQPLSTRPQSSVIIIVLVAVFDGFGSVGPVSMRCIISIIIGLMMLIIMFYILVFIFILILDFFSCVRFWALLL